MRTPVAFPVLLTTDETADLFGIRKDSISEAT